MGNSIKFVLWTSSDRMWPFVVDDNWAIAFAEKLAEVNVTVIEKRMRRNWCKLSRASKNLKFSCQKASKNLKRRIPSAYHRFFYRFSFWAIFPSDYRILSQRLFTDQLATSTNYTTIGHFNRRWYEAFTFKQIFFANFQRFNAWTHFEYIICTDHQNGRLGHCTCIFSGVMNYGGIFFDQTILADDNWSGFCNDCHSRMNDASTGNGDITGESAIVTFTNNCLWHNFQSKNVLKNKQTKYHAKLHKQTAISSTYSLFLFDIFQISLFYSIF